MSDFLVEHNREVYGVAFFATLSLVAFCEGILPLRPATQSLGIRWGGNFGLGILSAVTVFLVFPIAGLAFSIVVVERGMGLIPSLDISAWLAVPLGVLAIDLGRWGHHYLLHHVPFLWRFHRVHHADHDYDFTVGLRFHPVEALFTTFFIFFVIALIGPPPVAVVLADIFAAVSGLIAHANSQTPEWVERYVRFVFVTPGMHRIHHSILREEHDSNYASVFSFWDRVLRTYVAAPSMGQLGMTVGLVEFRDPRCLRLGWMLMAPFRSTASPAPVTSDGG